LKEEMNSLIKLNNIYKEDCISFMQENVFADVIVTSPPYNLNKEYEIYKDNKEKGDYLD
jgi:site-specific DNA-methyltransferase (adenine-specific)